MKNYPEYLTVTEASKILRIHPNTLRLWEKEGSVKSYRIDGKRFLRFKKADIIDLRANKDNTYEENIDYQARLDEMTYLASYPLLNPNPVIGTNKEGKIIFSNDATKKVMKLLGEVNPRVFLPADFNDILMDLKRKKHGKSYTREVRIKDRVYAESIYMTPYNTARIYTRDITKQKRAEERISRLNDELQHHSAQLEAERNRWQQLVENVVDEVWMCDNEGKMSMINLPKVTAMGLRAFKNKPIDVVMKKVDILNMDGTLRLKKDSPLLRSLRGEIVRGEEIMRHRQTGYTRYRQFSSAPIRDAHGKITGSVAIVRDITDQKKEEQRKDDFLGMASHELKTPLTSIKAYTQLLLSYLMRENNLKLSDLTKKTLVQINTLQEYINDLLDVNKINVGKLVLRETKFDIFDVLSETCDDFQQIHPNHTIDFDSVHQKICADKARISQVLAILVNNAVQYSPKGSKIVIKAMKKGKDLVISVKDLGIGIYKSEQGRIFDQFYQVDTPDRHKYGGLGLGLYIAKGIVSQHHGKIWVESKIRKGSTFFFTLPVKTDC